MVVHCCCEHGDTEHAASAAGAVVVVHCCCEYGDTEQAARQLVQ